MLDFRYVRFYYEPSLQIDLDGTINEISQLFPNCIFEECGSFFECRPDYQITAERARISEINQPFGHQPPGHHFFDLYGRSMALYDGFELQRLLASAFPETSFIPIILTDLLTCTFSEEDWRYHARALICGTPSVISTTGIVEAPAKPREFYLSILTQNVDSVKKKLSGKFIDYGDERMTKVAAGYVLQILFFFITNGDPFCEDISCRLHNAHWQEDLIRIQVENPSICTKHRLLASKFNHRLSTRESI